MQTVSNKFHELAAGGVRPHTYGLWVSFDKAYDDQITFGEWDTSEWDSGDLWSPPDETLLPTWNFYEYKNYSDRVVDMEWSREIVFPYSVSSAIADITVNNYDNFFTPDAGSPIDQYILPKRPLRLYAGFRGEQNLQQFIGLNEKMPVIDQRTKLATFHCLDFLAEMFAMPLTNLVAMSNVTTDEVLREIFTMFGLAPSQYVLAKGRNRIPFVFFDQGKNAGNAFRELMQAEGGNLWIDEQGIIRFEPRLLPVSDPVITFNDSNVEDIQTSGDSEIINTVRIKTDIRQVQDFQPVYTSSDEHGNTILLEPIVVPAGGTRFFAAELTDPLLSVSTPTLGRKIDDSWFTALNGETPVTTDVSITLTNLNNNNYVMLFENSNAFPVTIDKIEVWGEPAKLVEGKGINYEAYDDVSVEKYGEKVLEIENNLFGSESNAESFALTILDAYSELNGVIEFTAKGDPSLQLGDIINMDTRDIVGQYKLIGIRNSYVGQKATTIYKASRYQPRIWGFWDVTVWDDTEAVWAP